MFRMNADQIATLRSIHREAAAAPDPVAHLTSNLDRAFTDAQRSQIAAELEGYGRSFEGFAEALAADFVPDDEELILDSLRTMLEDQGLDVQLG